MQLNSLVPIFYKEKCMFKINKKDKKSKLSQLNQNC